MTIVLFCLCLSPAGAATTGGGDNNAYPLYLKALLLESQGNLTAAQEALESALKLTPESAYLHRTAAELAFRLGQLQKAADIAEKANELGPGDAKGFILAGQIYWALGESEKAELKLKKAVELAPDEAEAIVSLAGAVTPRDPKQAVKLYVSYLDRHPGEVEIQERVAQLYQSMGDIDNAEKAWTKALEWAPGSLRAHLALAQIAEVHYDTSTAISHYETVLEEDPSNLPLLLRVGELRYRSNEMAKAAEAFSKARSIAPESASANFWLALLAENRGDWNEAIRLLKQVAPKAPEPGILLRLSYYYSQAGRHKDAILLLKKLSATDPQNHDFLNYLSIAYEQDKQFGNAEKTIQKMIALNPQDAEAHFHLATVYDRMRKFPQAEAALKETIRLDSQYHIALNYLGYSYADRNIKLEEAERLVNTAIALDPDNGAYMDSMGWVHYRQGKFRKAEDFLKQAVALSNDPLIWDHLGDAQLAQDHALEALLSWDKSLHLDPTQKDVSAKVRKTMKQISAEQKLELFVKRAITVFEGLDAVRGMIQVKVCEERPCFESRANFSYEREKLLKVEVPGPLSAPVLLLTKTPGTSARYGAVHPLFQSVEARVTRAFERMEGVLSARTFKEIDINEFEKDVRRKGDTLIFNTEAAELDFHESQGRARRIKWHGAAPDSLVIGSYGESRASLPSFFEWKEESSGFLIRVEFISPNVSYAPVP